MKILRAGALALLAAAPANAWWLDADYTFGAGDLQKASAAAFFKPAEKWVVGLNSGWYRDGGAYPDKVWAVRLPVMRTMGGGLLTLKPFFYPESGDYDSSALGAKAGFMLPLGEKGSDGYRNLTLSAAGARQETRPAAAAAKESLSSCALEVQMEQSFFEQFFFLAHASGFVTNGHSNVGLAAPSLDNSELAFLGAFAPITLTPEWAAGLQFARNMAPDYDSHVYAGFSRISFKSAVDGYSGIFGIRLKVHERSSLDLGYNLYMNDGGGSRSRYKALYQVFF